MFFMANNQQGRLNKLTTFRLQLIQRVYRMPYSCFNGLATLSHLFMVSLSLSSLLLLYFGYTIFLGGVALHMTRVRPIVVHIQLQYMQGL